MVLLSFLGFNSTALNYESDFAQVETILVKITHKKRKDSSATSMQITLGTADVPINPLEGHMPLTAPTISIPTESFSNSNGPLVKSFILVFKVRVSVDGDHLDLEEPAAKKRKSNNGNCEPHSTESMLF